MTESDTRNKILTAAVQLFNERGTMEVTTNHIAAAAGISVGNLYYHFKNKEEIIRSIFTLIKKQGDTNWMPEDADGKDLMPLVLIMELLFRFYEHYSFLFRDYDYILRKDPDMIEAFRNLIKARKDSTGHFLDQARRAGLMKKLDEREMEALFHNTWLISNHWYSYAEMIGLKDREIIASRGVIQTLTPMRSALTRKGNEYLDRALEPYWKRGFP